jgi:AraC-like DNA-binding protein
MAEGLIRFPAPLALGDAPRRPPNMFDLPRLRWAARCDSAQFDPPGQVPFHAHHEAELVLCTRGRIWITVDDLRLEGRPGDLYVLPPHRPHAVTSDGDWENVCALFAGGEEILETGPRTIAVHGETRLSGWFDDLCDLHDRHPKMPGPVADSLLNALLHRVAERERDIRVMEGLHPRLAAAIEFLGQRPTAPVAAAELAAATGTSYSHLGALFRGRFGVGPLDYHRRQRMMRAQTLLHDPYMSVSEVADRMGYEDVNYFVRVFRKTVGVSPNRWRKTRRE